MSDLFYASVRNKESGPQPVKRCLSGVADCVISCAPTTLGDFMFYRMRRINGFLVSTRARANLDKWAKTPGVLRIAGDGTAEYHLPSTSLSRVSKGKALFAHGWEGCSGQLAAPAELLMAEGYEPLLFDFGLHGNSKSGDELTDLPRMYAEFLRVVERNCGPSMHVPVVVGHSFGVTVIKKAIAEGRLTCDRLVVFSVPHESLTEAAHFVITETLGLSENACNAFLDAFARSFPDKFGAFDTSSIGGAPGAEVAKSILTLHAAPDRTSPNEHSVDIWRTEGQKKGANLTVRLLTGTGHVGIIRDARSLHALRQFVRGQAVPDEAALAREVEATRQLELQA